MEKSLYRVHYIQHVPYEGLGYIEEWVADRGFGLSVTHMYDDYTFPDVADIDMLIIMGGPMGVYEEEKYIWLKDEKAFVRKAIEVGKTTVGICLGAQIIADVLGAKVYPNKEKEIGWWPISFVDSAACNLFGSVVQSPIVFQWHGDTFDLPDDVAVRQLASSNVCKNQAFIYRKNVVALQFHLEVTEDSCNEMLRHGQKELISGKCIQSAEFIASDILNIPSSNRMMKTILDNLIKGF